MANIIVSTYRKLTHKNPSYNREDAFEEKQKINDWLDYGSLRGLANMTEREMVDGRLEILRKEQNILNNLLPETQEIRAYRDKFERPIFGLWFQVKHNSENEKEAIQSVRKQTEAELGRFGYTSCECRPHQKLEEIDIVARALDKRSEIDKRFYAILATLEDRIVGLRGMAEKGNANIDSELDRIRKDFDKNIKLFEDGTLDDSDKELLSHYIFVH